MSATLDARTRFLDRIDNINDIIERIALGPQEEVLSLFNQLNTRYNTDFRCTPTFRWQPGFYKKLTKEAGRISNITIQKNKVSTYSNKIQQGRWYVDSFMSKINELDNKLFHLRNDGIAFQDNSEDVNRVLDEYRSNISETIDTAMQLFPNMNLSVTHGLYTSNSLARRYNGTKHAVSFHIHIENVNTNINIGGESVEIPMGNIDLVISVDLVKNIMNRIQNASRVSRNHSQGGHSNTWNGAIYDPQERDILFPYITNQRYSSQLEVLFPEGQNTRSRFYNVCFGSFNDDIVESAWRGDMLAMLTYIHSWTRSFNVGSTGPLNGFERMFHGIWPEMDTEAWESSGRLSHTSRRENCSYADYLNTQYISDLSTPSQSESYCDRYECVLRNDCRSYQSVYNTTPQEAETAEEEVAFGPQLNRLTEAEVLSMYQGVNTIDVRR